MSGFFWLLFGVNAVFAGLVTLALPHGENFVYALMAGSQLGMIALLARARVEAPPRMDDRPRGEQVGKEFFSSPSLRAGIPEGRVWRIR